MFLAVRNSLRFLALAVVLGLFVSPARLLAQGLAVVPATLEQTYKPGQALEMSFTVVNDTSKPIAFQATAMDWWYNDKNEKVFAVPGTYPHTASNWVEFVPRQFTVEPKKNQRVRVLVTPPPGDTPGGHYSVLFVESKPELVQAGSADRKALFSNVRLGVLMMLAQAGTEQFKLQVSDAKLLPPGTAHNLQFDFSLANAGNTHIFPRPSLVILDAKKQLVGKAEGEVKRFMPDQHDRMSITWPTALAPGGYTAILTIVYGDNQVFTQEFPFTIP
jgi:hypothetical protein